MNDNDIMYLEINTPQKNKLTKCHLTSHLISLCPLAHQALTICLHLSLTLAAALADAQLFHSCCYIFYLYFCVMLYFPSSFWMPCQCSCTNSFVLYFYVMANQFPFPNKYKQVTRVVFCSHIAVFLQNLIWISYNQDFSLRSILKGVNLFTCPSMLLSTFHSQVRYQILDKTVN